MNAAKLPKRLASMDAYRGFVMLLIMAEALGIPRVASHYPDSAIWSFLAFHADHVDWVGCSLHDLIQPSFSFLVGAALPYSLASRLAGGQSKKEMFIHALWRALLLVLLGVFLRSVGHPETNWTFEDTLTQIGLGYPFLFLFGFCSSRVQWTTLGVILVGYWLAWALYPLPGPDFDYARVGVPADWSYHFQGFAAHWNRNSNLGAVFDRWFLNLFPRSTPFIVNEGGYLTLNFIPTLGTMMLGLIAGRWLRMEISARRKMQRFMIAGIAGIAIGLLLNRAGVCPLVKHIWTPTWTLYSGGWCFLLLTAFYAIIDVWNRRAWAFAFIVVGMNSIAAYCLQDLMTRPIANSLRTHLGTNAFKLFGEPFERLLLGGAVVAILWLILFWMYRRKLFLKI
jgi:predicted acyltransferase